MRDRTKSMSGGGRGAPRRSCRSRQGSDSGYFSCVGSSGRDARRCCDRRGGHLGEMMRARKKNIGSRRAPIRCLGPSPNSDGDVRALPPSLGMEARRSVQRTPAYLLCGCGGGPVRGGQRRRPPAGGEAENEKPLGDYVLCDSRASTPKGEDSNQCAKTPPCAKIVLRWNPRTNESGTPFTKAEDVLDERRPTTPDAVPAAGQRPARQHAVGQADNAEAVAGFR